MVFMRTSEIEDGNECLRSLQMPRNVTVKYCIWFSIWFRALMSEKINCGKNTLRAEMATSFTASDAQKCLHF